MPSFYSERTAEYALAPKFLKLLEPLGPAVPIFFSGRREDTLIAFDSLSGESFHLVAFFARRPKINETNSLTINGKINKRLLRVADCASKLGIKTICGISLTNNIFDQSRAESLWFDISHMAAEQDIQFACEVTRDLELKSFHGHIQPVTPSTIISSIANSRIVDWAEATNIMRELPKLADDFQPRQSIFFSQTWRMRPLYFVIRRS
ncbi:hypothetical protein [Pseudomonas syringae]|uniref:Uncharacterized protein n=1 Tax=Pseudomonas syringae pv. aptata TaxID=83167 RepID=A0A0Q0BYM3_PSEAP|nr:hypothetical protein [Pseudomonas syringae]KPZ01422.1 hypothetical protein ALO85_200112 [Pseudomonas syringae pv. aptata]MEE1994015.1 hypothetical protein [Pseudomonas syringae pv. syringae]MEE1999199.1 hypothetical protein [Pseudomonas syringae pv. syringae]RMO65999.1 hypothetical protein ALQ37_200181 [Pseudomonas syringae pv. aptata]